jgi:hypothetical protein
MVQLCVFERKRYGVEESVAGFDERQLVVLTLHAQPVGPKA